jgi:hypothetical protein
MRTVDSNERMDWTRTADSDENLHNSLLCGFERGLEREVYLASFTQVLFASFLTYDCSAFFFAFLCCSVGVQLQKHLLDQHLWQVIAEHIQINQLDRLSLTMLAYQLLLFSVLSLIHAQEIIISAFVFHCHGDRTAEYWPPARFQVNGAGTFYSQSLRRWAANVF